MDKILRQTEDQLPPLRYFSGVRVSQTYLKSILKKNKTSEGIMEAINSSEKDLRISCTPHDENGKHISLNFDDIYDRRDHEKSFLFRVYENKILILEMHHSYHWQEWEDWHGPTASYAPIIDKVSLKKEEQKKVFKIFKELVEDTEKINGFSIMDKRHSIYSKPEFRSLLIRILNSNQFKEV